MMTEAWSRAEFLERLQDVGSHAYHHLHPFHVRMNAGSLDRDSIRLWVANRFYYQRSIPIKDAAILSNCPLREVRREWVKRIVDHDGSEGEEGGIEKWIRLALACGLTREETIDERQVVPGVRFAVDAYVNFARSEPWPIAIASSLTELFAPDLMGKRLDAFQKYYTWIAPDGLDYFRARLTQARKDSEFALSATLKYCADRNMQEAAVKALRFKCDVLWSMLDALMMTGPPGETQSGGNRNLRNGF
ncbi:MAG: pyrroloquinoline-quinone synthase PqqC [Chthoniobacterales bacterium]